MKLEILNPETMFQPRGYAHAIKVSGAHQTLYIGGQNAVDKDGTLVGKGDLKAQTLQALNNIERILDAAGANYEQVVKFGVHVVHGQDPLIGFQAFQEKWGARTHTPTVTVLLVAGLGQNDWLVEIDAIAVIPE